MPNGLLAIAEQKSSPTSGSFTPNCTRTSLDRTVWTSIDVLRQAPFEDVLRSICLDPFLEPGFSAAPWPRLRPAQRFDCCWRGLGQGGGGGGVGGRRGRRGLSC